MIKHDQVHLACGSCCPSCSAGLCIALPAPVNVQMVLRNLSAMSRAVMISAIFR